MTPSKNQLRFAEHMHDRKPPSGLDVQTALAHFAIVTFQVDKDEVRKLIHPRFELDLIEVDGCKQRSFRLFLLSTSIFISPVSHG